MLKRLNKIANASIKLSTIALTKRAGLATPLASVGASVAKKVGVGGTVLGVGAGGVGAVGAVNKARQVEKEKFNPAKRDLMLGTAAPG